MGHRLKPRSIVDVDRFEDDLAAMHDTMLRYTDTVRTSSPHYAPLRQLADNIVETMRAVTGREPPWVRNRGNVMDGHFPQKRR